MEGDLLDEERNCCFEITNQDSDFRILSCHHNIYQGELKNVNQAYHNAFARYADQIAFVAHPCLLSNSEFLDIPSFAKLLNHYQLPIEVNTSYLRNQKTDLEKLHQLLELLETGVYINSDMHTFADRETRTL